MYKDGMSASEVTCYSDIYSYAHCYTSAAYSYGYGDSGAAHAYRYSNSYSCATHCHT